MKGIIHPKIYKCSDGLNVVVFIDVALDSAISKCVIFSTRPILHYCHSFGLIESLSHI